MNITVDNRTKTKVLGFLIKRKVTKLLRCIPKEHLIGLNRVVIVNEIATKKGEQIGGIYKRKDDDQPCLIELSMSVIFKGMPRILYFLPFIPDFTLADVLYHEIGHHYRERLTHGISKQRGEIFAENYRTEMLKKRFRRWTFLFIPLAPLIKYLKNKLKE